MKVTYFFILILLFPFMLDAQWSTDPNNNLVIAIGWDPHIVSDSAGGCYITYNYESFYPQKLAVERLDKYGYKPWGDKKQILGELPEQWQAEIVEDGEGGVIVSYQDNELNLPDFTTRVRVQKVDSNGNFLWSPTGVRVTTNESNQGSQSLVNDGDGGCIVVWTQLLTDYTYDFRANRINNMGERAWSDTGIYLENRIESDPAQIVKASDENFYVQIRRNLYRIRENGEIVRRDSVTLGYPIPDPEGGVILSGKTGTINNVKLVAQRKDSLGNSVWQEPHIVVAESLYFNSRPNIQYNSSYYYFGWSGMNNGIDRIAQFQALREDGSKLFLEGSISISENTPIGSPYITPSEASKTIFIWNDATISSSTIAQLYDTLGNKLWNENGIIVSYPAIAVETTTDGQGGFITMGPINQFTIVAQQVSKYGNLGEIITSIAQEYQQTIPSEINLYQNYPNPFNSSTIIKYQIAEESNVKISLYNILGERLIILSNEYKSEGTHSLIFNSANLPTGVYIYALETKNKVLTKKLTILK